jgi:hypothetical protein
MDEIGDVAISIKNLATGSPQVLEKPRVIKFQKGKVMQ